MILHASTKIRQLDKPWSTYHSLFRLTCLYNNLLQYRETTATESYRPLEVTHTTCDLSQRPVQFLVGILHIQGAMSPITFGTANNDCASCHSANYQTLFYLPIYFQAIRRDYIISGVNLLLSLALFALESSSVVQPLRRRDICNHLS